MVVENKLTDKDKTIKNFKDAFYNLYGVKLYIYTPLKNQSIISIKAFHDAALSALHENNPDFINIEHLSYKLKTRRFAIYVQVMCFLAVNAGHTKVDVGKFLKRHHASVIYSCTAIKDAFSTNDALILSAYNSTLKKLKNYVGSIPENNKSKSNT